MARTPAAALAPGRPLTLAGVADGAEGLVIADLARAVAARADAPATSLVVVCRDGQRMAALARGSASSRLTSLLRSFLPGTVCPMIASRRMRPSSPSA